MKQANIWIQKSKEKIFFSSKRLSLQPWSNLYFFSSQVLFIALWLLLLTSLNCWSTWTYFHRAIQHHYLTFVFAFRFSPVSQQRPVILRTVVISLLAMVRPIFEHFKELLHIIVVAVFGAFVAHFHFAIPSEQRHLRTTHLNHSHPVIFECRCSCDFRGHP